MIENDEPAFSISEESDKLVFRTAHFGAGRGSVLHSGIYNREFSSVLASFTVAGLVYFFLVMQFGREAVLYFAALLLFVIAFPLFRKYVFRERFLEAIFDRAGSEVMVSISWIWERVVLKLPLSSIKGLRIESRKDEVINRDGVEFVERISAMHGTVIPGFGEEKTFYLLMLCLADGAERAIFEGSDARETISAYDRIREFLKI